MLVGIAFLSAFATFYARALLQTYGREVVEITNQSITIRRAVLGLGAPREYLADSVQALRLVTSNTALDHPGLAWTRIYGFPFLRVGTGWLAFDYGARTFRFGNDIEEAEAKQIIAEIQQKYPQYKD